MDSLLDKIIPDVNVTLKYIFPINEYDNNVKDIITSVLASIKLLRNNLNKSYSSYVSIISVYNKQICDIIKEKGTINLKYINEEYCKGVPKAQIISLDLKKLNNVDKLADMQKLFLVNKMGLFPDLKRLEKASERESKFQQLYRSYLYNPKVKLSKTDYDKFNKIGEKIFLSGKSVIVKDITTLMELNSYTKRNYMNDEMQTLKGLLDDFETSMKKLSLSPKIPSGMDEDAKIKYLKDYAYNLNKLYQSMYAQALSIFLNKMNARQKLLGLTVRSSNTN